MDKEQMIIQDMKRLGFSEYECKAYLKLLEEYPQNGYTLSKHSGIPRSRIYEVLKNLIDKQLVFEQEEDTNKFYYPIEPEIFINHLKTDFDTLFTHLSDYTRKLYQGAKEDDKLVIIKGRNNIINFLKLLIKSATKRLAVSIWEDEIKDLYPEIDQALQKGVMLKGIYFGEQNRYDTLVPHRRITRYMADKKERYLSIIIDSMHAVSGIVSRGENSKVTWTQEEGFIEISEDYIAHDLVVNLYSASLDKKAYQQFEDFVDNVHHAYFQYSDEELASFKTLK